MPESKLEDRRFLPTLALNISMNSQRGSTFAQLSRIFTEHQAARL